MSYFNISNTYVGPSAATYAQTAQPIREYFPFDPRTKEQKLEEEQAFEAYRKEFMELSKDDFALVSPITEGENESQTLGIQDAYAQMYAAQKTVEQFYTKRGKRKA